MVLRAGSVETLEASMDKDHEVTEEPSVHPCIQRERRPPAHLNDYEVEYHPKPVSVPPPLSSKSPSHKSLSGSQCSRQRSQVSVNSISGRSTTAALTDVQAAELEERIKRLELTELKRQVEEQHIAEQQCQLLDDQARKALDQREELLREQERKSRQLDEEARAAHRSRECLTRQLALQRRLKEKEIELEKARLIAAFLKESEIESSEHSTPNRVSEVIFPAQSSSDPTVPAPCYKMTPVNQAPPSVALQQSPPAPPVQQHTTGSPARAHQVAQIYATMQPNETYDLNMQSPWAPPFASTLLPSVPQGFSVPSQPPSHPVQPPRCYKTPDQVSNPHRDVAGLNMIGQAQSHPVMQNNPDIGPNLHHPAPQPSYTQPRLSTSHLNQGSTSAPNTSLMDLLIATSYGIPKPSLPTFSSGKESDFALLKMGLDSLMGAHSHLTETFKYQVLLDHLKLPSAYKLAQAYMYDPTPYTTALHALQEKYGQPRQLVQSELGTILNAPLLRMGDTEGFDNFALAVHALVGMLRSLEGDNGYELKCGSHVDRLLSKLPANYRDGFVEYCFSHGILQTGTDRTYTLPEFSAWLQLKSKAKRISSRAAELFHEPVIPMKKVQRNQRLASTIYYGAEHSVARDSTPSSINKGAFMKGKDKPKPYCPYCNTREHYLSVCAKFKSLNPSQISEWLKDKGCWRCGRNHKPEKCTLKKPCSICKRQHLTVLHEASQQETRQVLMVNASPDTIYLDRPNRPQRVMLKVVKVILHSGDKSLEAFAVLDDGSERTIILSPAVQCLGLGKEPEILSLRTIRHDVIQLQGSSVSFDISPAHNPSKRFKIHHAFSADELGLSEHSYPVKALTAKYHHLQGLPLSPIDRVHPVVLIGSDFPHLLVPTQPVRIGPPGGPVAVCTSLGWALQGPSNIFPLTASDQQCLFTTVTSPASDLLLHVEKLWQLDTLPYAGDKRVTRSKLDQQALALLEQHTAQVKIDGVMRYATPLLRRKDSPLLKAPTTACLSLLRSTERRNAKNVKQAQDYHQEMAKLEQAGHVQRLSPESVESTTESWFLPHHLVYHNGKARLVFNCSFQYGGQSLNNNLLAGPVLGPSLLGVLLRFREHTVAISGDIKSMFHQICLLPQDRPLLRFLWRERKEDEPTVFEWQVLPFGTTCSPCCAIYALQHHVREHREGNGDIVNSVEQAFYVDNCLQSFTSVEKAKNLIDRIRALLAAGGFEIRQWASNVPETIKHLPADAKATSTELWLSQQSQDPQESTLGLRWNFLTDCLGYRHRPVEYSEPTLRNVYKVLATQYDPLGYLVPFTTRAKVIIQDLWKTEIGWDELLPAGLLELWRNWEAELVNLPLVEISRCYVPPCADSEAAIREAHVFCDASERVYGSVAYLRTQCAQEHVHVSFVMARSRVAPRKQISMPRLELCAALTGAQLAGVLNSELAIPISDITMWTDSTTVLNWIQSDSCRYKVFVGTRISEIQTLTEVTNWRYVNTADNPADDLTRGKSLLELSRPHRWNRGPQFLHYHPSSWPSLPVLEPHSEDKELKKAVFCGNTTVTSPQLPDISQFKTWTDLINTTHHIFMGRLVAQKSVMGLLQMPWTPNSIY
ncbi:uncharacterized protein LOC111195821 [Astyanax mexicanus]|uniref:uncharacterized protein LOC111195821 n=1 Tax=Astyanax mexicanus TaxID=7994 RepID=UPI0020CB11BB|nr:uncharacterized protein LOC111195821 [Astyanax mexicanus]